MCRSSLVTLSALVLLLSGQAIQAGDWPGWRGPTGQGISDAKDLPLTWGGDKGENVLWKAPLPGSDGKAKPDHNQASPIVWKDRVFVTMVFWPAGVTQKEMPEHHVACYQLSDGKQLWDTTVPPGPWLLTDLRGGYSAPTPITDGERVYALFGSAVLAALDFKGNIVWRKGIDPHSFDVAIGTSPILAGDKVLVLCDMTQPKLSRLAAYDKATGELKWEEKRPTSGFGHTTPLLTEVAGKPQLLIASSGAVQGVDPSNGKLLWWCANKGDVATPAHGGGIVFSVDGRGGTGIAIDPTGTDDVSKTNVKWKTKPIPEGYSSPVIVGDYVYFVHNPGILKCWKLDSGDQVYSERLPNGVASAGSPIVTADGRLYFAGGGKSAVVAVGPKFEVLGTGDLGDSSNASPAVADGKLFLKGGRNLYCIGKK